VTFLSFASGGPPDQRDHYETGLYVVCYQGYVGESYNFGLPRISEIGILTRNGTVEDYVFEHYQNRLDEISGLGLPEELVLKTLNNSC